MLRKFTVVGNAKYRYLGSVECEYRLLHWCNELDTIDIALDGSTVLLRVLVFKLSRMYTSQIMHYLLNAEFVK